MRKLEFEAQGLIKLLRGSFSGNLKLLMIFPLVLVLIGGLYTGCRKSEGSGQEVVIDSEVAKARAWFIKEVVDKERRLLSLNKMPSGQDSLRKIFARMTRVEKKLKWQEAKSYARNDVKFVVVPLDNIAQHFINKKYTASRSVVFYADESGKMDMHVIEILGKEAATYNLQELSRTAFENRYFKKSDGYERLTANILFYDRNYANNGSYQLTNGAWSGGNFFLSFKKAFTARDRIMASYSQGSSCGTCTKMFLVGFWYDKVTFEVVDYEILAEWDECSEEYKEPEYGDGVTQTNNTDCMEECIKNIENLSGSSSTDNSTVSVTFQTISNIRKYKNIKWKIHRGFGWNIYSYEKGVVRLADPATNKWVWESLEHERIALEGFALGGTVTPQEGSATPSFTPGTPNVLYAGMHLKYSIKFTPLCGDCIGIEEIIKPYVISYEAGQIWSANP